MSPVQKLTRRLHAKAKTQPSDEFAHLDLPVAFKRRDVADIDRIVGEIAQGVLVIQAALEQRHGTLERDDRTLDWHLAQGLLQICDQIANQCFDVGRRLSEEDPMRLRLGA